MRKTVAILILTLVAALGTFVPAVSAAPAAAQPKVVIIVGATHGDHGDVPDLRGCGLCRSPQVHDQRGQGLQPVRDVGQGQGGHGRRSVVIYMGHGNGWPSPYTYDPLYTTKDGFGLNATSGAGDYNNKYYGEPYVASSTSPMTRSCCCITCATRRATPSRAARRRPCRSLTSASTTTRPGS